MSGDTVHQNERQTILTRCLDAVKQCQVRFGGRSELATDSDSRVSCLCAAWETALQHGLKRSSKALAAFKHMTERAGLTKVTDLFSDIKRLESDQVFWHYAKEHLTKHELQRFIKLKLVTTDTGRGRAWLRASLNEHCLERYMHMLIESDDMLSQHYEDWAFLRDLERSSMLPNMAAGLGSILFAITVDRPELNKAYAQQNNTHVQNNIEGEGNEGESEPQAVISEALSPASGKRKEKKKKKKTANVVSFDEDDPVAMVITKSGSTSSGGGGHLGGHLADPVALALQHNGETREGGEGTNYEDAVFETEPEKQEPSPEKGEVTTVTTAAPAPLRDKPHELEREMSKASLSMSFSSDRLSSRSSAGSFSDVDSNSFMVPVGADGATVESDMLRYSRASSSSHSTSHTSFEASMENSPHAKDMESASLALALAQQGLTDSRTDGDGGSPPDKISRGRQDGMSEGELKQAVVAMMLRKDSVEEQNKKLEGMLQHEMETSSTLRAEREELRGASATRQEKEQARVLALYKENELLKHQLKKYVNAVQMLRTEGGSKEDSLGIHLEEPQPSIPPVTSGIDYSHEAAEYEKKLIQVAEMHGELMEFNEQLHRTLNSREGVIRSMRGELVLLRGPLPSDRRMTINEGAMESLGFQTTLINIWIPSAFLRGSNNNTHHVYQVYVRIRDEEWNIYRRYSQFLDMHTRLRKVYPIIGKFEFPSKKTIGKKEAKLVESRRQLFQTYLRSVINIVLEKNESLSSAASKEKLISYLPFFNDKTEEDSKKGKKGKKSSSSGNSVSASVPEGRASESRGAGYQGL